MRDEERKEFVYLNGSLVSKRDAKVSVFDRGFLYGDGVFETVRIYNGRPFMLDEHMERLIAGLKTLRFQKLPSGIKVHASRLIEANKIENGTLRIAVSRGELTSGADPAGCKDPTVVITARENIPYAEGLYEKGFRAIISTVRKDHLSPICNIKSANFLIFILAKDEATKAGADEAILLNYDGFIAEGSVSNVFILKGDILLTPSLQSGILPGVTRKSVVDISRGLGLNVAEREIRPEDFFDANEAFLTNSIMEVMPLIEVDKRPIGAGHPGKKTKEIHKRYRQLVLT